MELFAAEHRKALYCILILAGAVLLLGGILLGLCIGGRTPAQTPPPQAQAVLPTPTIAPTPSPEPVLSVDRIGEAGILPETQVAWETLFSSCGHTYPREIESDVTGCTEAELRTRFPGVQVAAFSAERVLLKETCSGYCPAHLLVTLREEKPVILQTDPDTLAASVLIELNWDVSGLSRTAFSELQAGIPFESLAQIDEYIESLES